MSLFKIKLHELTWSGMAGVPGCQGMQHAMLRCMVSWWWPRMTANMCGSLTLSEQASNLWQLFLAYGLCSEWLSGERSPVNGRVTLPAIHTEISLQFVLGIRLLLFCYIWPSFSGLNKQTLPRRKCPLTDYSCHLSHRLDEPAAKGGVWNGLLDWHTAMDSLRLQRHFVGLLPWACLS